MGLKKMSYQTMEGVGAFGKFPAYPPHHSPEGLNVNNPEYNSGLI
jgi:hypothetical protein